MVHGAQDWTSVTRPARMERLPTQQIVSWSEVSTVPAGTYSQADVYTVPTGKELHIAYVVISCEVSCIQRFELIDNTYAFIGSYYDTVAIFTPAEKGTYVLAAGHTLKRGIYNFDTSGRTFRIVIHGTLVG